MGGVFFCFFSSACRRPPKHIQVLLASATAKHCELRSTHGAPDHSSRGMACLVPLLITWMISWRCVIHVLGPRAPVSLTRALTDERAHSGHFFLGLAKQAHEKHRCHRGWRGWGESPTLATLLHPRKAPPPTWASESGWQFEPMESQVTGSLPMPPLSKSRTCSH